MKIENSLKRLDNLHEVLDYNADTGHFFWKVRRGGKALKGSIAGTLSSDGYVRIQFDKKAWLAHKLAWFLTYGTYPDNLDHIDEDKTNNTIHNLRIAEGSLQNLNKSKPRVDNLSTGLKGVTINKTSKSNPYVAAITFKGKRKHIGSFNTPIEAHNAYLKAKEGLMTREYK